MGKPKVQEGSGKENLKMYVSLVSLIFFAKVREILSSLSLGILYKAPPPSGIVKNYFLNYSLEGLAKYFLTKNLITKIPIIKGII